MRTGLLKSLIFWVCFGFAEMGLAQVGGTAPQKLPCLGDQVAEMLRNQFPDGVPGRTIPTEIPTEKTDSVFTYFIPVVVHVMHAYGPEKNVTEAQIHSFIDVMNEGFGRYGEGANQSALGGDVNIRFCLASIDPDGNPTPGYDYTVTNYAVSLNPLTQDTLLKKLNQWDPLHYMNVWTVRKIKVGNTEYEGYTYIPEQVAGTAYDGIVMEHIVLGRDAGTANQRGKTGTHEAGHFFDLHHPWGDGELQYCPAFSDYCDDTPEVPNIQYTSFPTCLYPNLIPVACDGGPRQVENYMDYNDDECQNLFTHCQIQRMRSALLRFRSEMVSIDNLRRTGCGQALDTLPAQGQIFVYPNPANYYMMVNVDIEDAGELQLFVYDFTGRVVWVQRTASVGRGPVYVDLSKLAQGTYYLKAITSKASVSTKFLVGGYH